MPDNLDALNISHVREQAVDKNNGEALYELGYRYLNGIGVPFHNEKGISLLEKAAKRFDKKAKCLLGIIYYEGILRERDEDKAFDYLQQAVVGRYTDAKAYFYLGKIYKEKGSQYDVIVYALLNISLALGNKEARELFINLFDPNNSKYLFVDSEIEYINKVTIAGQELSDKIWDKPDDILKIIEVALLNCKK